MASLVEIFKNTVQQFGDRDAVLYHDGGDEATRLTYAQLCHLSSLVSSHLTARDVQNEVVAVALKPSAQHPAVLIGIMQTPAAYLPLEENVPPQKLLHLVKTLHVRIIIMTQDYTEDFCEKLAGFHMEIDAIPGTGLSLIHLLHIEKEVHDIHLAYVITTSGTTGKPKIVKVPHECIVPNIRHLSAIFGIGSEDIVFQASPLTFDPSVVEQFCTFLTGATLLVVPDIVKQSGSLLHKVLMSCQVTVLQATPSLMQLLGPRILYTGLLGKDSVLRALALGGEACPPRGVLRTWKHPENSTLLYNLYGITEVSSWAACCPVSGIHDSNMHDDIPLGDALEGTLMELRNMDGQVVQQGEGVLHIGGRACLLDDETSLDAAKMRSSGDVVFKDDCGQLWYRGRHDDQVKRHGKRLNLIEIEKVVTKHCQITQACCIMSEAKLWLICARRPPVGTDGILSVLGQHLPAHYMPDKVVFTEEPFPATTHGKVDKSALLELASRNRSHSDENTEASSPAELLQSLWRECLDLQSDIDIQEDDQFLAMGGTSLTAVQLMHAIEDALNVPLTELLDHILNGTYCDVLKYIQGQILETDNQPSDGHEQMECHDVNLNRITKRKSIPAGLVEQLPEKVIKSEHLSNTTGERRPSLDKSSISDHCESCHRAQVATHLISLRRGCQIMSHHALSKSTCSDSTNDNRSVAPNFRTASSHSRHKFEKVTAEQLTDNGNAVSYVSRPFQSSTVDKVDVKEGSLQTDVINSNLHGSYQLTEMWKYDTGKCVDASPALLLDRDDGLVFIGSHSHQMAALDFSSGRCSWTQILPDRIESSAAVSRCSSKIIVGCYDGHIYILDKVTGDILWSVLTEGPVKSSPAVDPATGLVFVGSHDQHLYALNIEKNEVVWRRNLDGGSVFSSPVMMSHPHRVYAATLRGSLVALEPLCGSVLWHCCLDSPVFSSPAVWSGGLCVGCVDGSLYCYSHRGVQLWSFKTGDPIFSSPAIWNSATLSETLILVGSHDHHIYCLCSSGNVRWKYKCNSPVYATPYVFKLSPLKYYTVYKHGSPCKRMGDLPTKRRRLFSGTYSEDICSDQCRNNECEGNIANSVGVNPVNKSEHGRNEPEMGGCQSQHASAGPSLASTGKFARKEHESPFKCNKEMCSSGKPNPKDGDISLGNFETDIPIVNPGCMTRRSRHRKETSQRTSTELSESSDKKSPVTLVCIGSTMGDLHVLNVFSGEVVADYRLPGELFSSPVCHEDKIVVGCRDDFVYCLKLAAV